MCVSPAPCATLTSNANSIALAAPDGPGRAWLVLHLARKSPPARGPQKRPCSTWYAITLRELLHHGALIEEICSTAARKGPPRQVLHPLPGQRDAQAGRPAAHHVGRGRRCGGPPGSVALAPGLQGALRGVRQGWARVARLGYRHTLRAVMRGLTLSLEVAYCGCWRVWVSTNGGRRKRSSNSQKHTVDVQQIFVAIGWIVCVLS